MDDSGYLDEGAAAVPEAAPPDAMPSERPGAQALALRRVDVASWVVASVIMSVVAVVLLAPLSWLGHYLRPHSIFAGRVLLVLNLLGPLFAAAAGALNAVLYNYAATRVGSLWAVGRWRGPELRLERVDPSALARVATVMSVGWLPAAVALGLALFVMVQRTTAAHPTAHTAGDSGTRTAVEILFALILCAVMAVVVPVCAWLGGLLSAAFYNAAAGLTGGAVVATTRLGQARYRLGLPRLGVTGTTLFLANLPWVILLALHWSSLLLRQHAGGRPSAAGSLIVILVESLLGPWVRTLGYCLAARLTGGVVVDLEPVERALAGSRQLSGGSAIIGTENRGG